MGSTGYFETMDNLTFAEQRAWMQSVRPSTVRSEFVFSGSEEKHPLLDLLAHLDSERTIGAGPGNGYYGRDRPNVVKRSYAYDRDIIRAIESLGGFFPDPESTSPWTGLGDVDVIFLDRNGKLLGATVAHERMIITPEHEEAALAD